MASKVSPVVAFLKSQASVTAIVDARNIYDEEFPDSLISKMPKPAILVQSAGGSRSIGTSWNDHGDGRVDVKCYAFKTKSSAIEIETVVFDALRNALRKSAGGYLLHSCREAGGLISGYEPVHPVVPGKPVDPSKSWPFAMRAWQVHSSDVPIP